MAVKFGLLPIDGVRYRVLLFRTVVLAFLAFGLAVAASCGGNESARESAVTAAATVPGTEEVTPTTVAEPTSTPAATHGPPPTEEEFFAFATALDANIQAGDLRQLLGSFQTEHVVCPEDIKAPRGIGGPDCRYPRQEFEGILVTPGFEGVVVPVEDVTDLLTALKAGERPDARDTFGDGRFRVYAILYNPAITRDRRPFGVRYGMVVTAIVESETHSSDRVAYVLNWSAEPGGWRIINVVYKVLGFTDTLSPEAVLSKTRAEANYPGATWTQLPLGK
jgi:hypothetical protein